MTSTVQLRRRTGVANPGSPAGTVGEEGELCLNLSTTVPELWAKQGDKLTGTWKRVNPPAGAITTANLTLPAAADIGAAYAAWLATPNPAPTQDIVIATFGTPPAAYLLTNKAAPSNTASWTSLGGSVAFATPAEVLAGTDATKAINPVGLESRLVAAPNATPANDAGKIVKLDAAGKIPSGFLTISGLAFSAAAPTSAAPAHANGKAVFMNAAGTLDASWGLGANVDVDAGDLLISDGAAWHMLEHNVNTGAFLALAGGTMASGATITMTPAAAGDVVIDGGGGALDGVTLDGGTF